MFFEVVCVASWSLRSSEGCEEIFRNFENNFEKECFREVVKNFV